MLIPKHLEKILRVSEYDDLGSLSGQIVCECGSETFGIKYFGEVFCPGCIGMSEYNGKYAHTVKAVCRECGKEWLLYDFAKHGYDGLICRDGISVPDEELIDAAADNERDFEDPPAGMSFSPDDRVNIWSWIVIDLKCAESGKTLDGFVDSELA